MLGLATHEPNFTIIREEFKPNGPRPCPLCRQTGHEMVDCQGAPRPIEGSEYVGEEPQTFGEGLNYIFVRLSVLREYLRRDLAMPNLPFPYDFERAIDDWVFMCFFVGNDFLPHLPSLEIREGAIDRLVSVCLERHTSLISLCKKISNFQVGQIVQRCGLQNWGTYFHLYFKALL